MKWLKGTCQTCGRFRKVTLSTSQCYQCSHPPLPGPAPALVKCKYCQHFDEIEKMHEDIYTKEHYHQGCMNSLCRKKPTDPGIFTASQFIEKEGAWLS